MSSSRCKTLNFREYCEMKRFLGLAINPNPAAGLDEYILAGGFPKALDCTNLADKRAYVKSVIQEIFEKDIKRRVKIKNVSVFNTVRDYVINNFGATTPLSNILSDLKAKQGVRMNRETLNRYLQVLEDAKIISRRIIVGFLVFVLAWRDLAVFQILFYSLRL